MECPRCGDRLAELALQGRRAVVCEGCQYVDVPADHGVAERAEGESWEEVLERFRRERSGR